MRKKRVALIFGGKSGEHEVSLSSAQSIFKALDKSKYEILLIGIDPSGRWLLPNPDLFLVHPNPRDISLADFPQSVALVPYKSEGSLTMVGSTSNPSFAENLNRNTIDVIFPVLHGTFGEDGTIQGLLEMAQIPFVGSGVLGSALGMDKEISRKLFRAEGIPVVPTLTFSKYEFQKNKKAAIDATLRTLGLPFFVKPANAGSSVGVSKVKTESEALEKFDLAFQFDVKVLAEKAIPARELEVSVLGNHDPKVSVVGEVIPQHEFYSYEAKYIDAQGALFKIPADYLKSDDVKKIQGYAVRAFKCLECAGMSRVDFFQDKNTGEIFLNEINTIPGFTSISQYPKLWEASGLKYPDLLDQLIQLAEERFHERSQIKSSYQD